MVKHYISFWNVENLFNEVNDPNRSEWLQKKLRNELKGWTAEVLNAKLDQLSKIILLLNEENGPDILGVCEVESVSVLDKLIGTLNGLNRDYKIAHYDSEDKRGIDVAFIYDSDLYEVQEQFSRRITKRTATRDIFQVNFKIKASGKELVLIGNHWPARIPSTYETEPYRILAGETLSYWLSRIVEIKGKDAYVLAMGDFNDEPFSRSLSDYALGTHSKQKVVNSRTSPRLLNLMPKQLGEGLGSFYYSGPFMFDQFLASKGMVKSSSDLKVNDNGARVENFDLMSKGSYNAPKRFGRPSSKSSFDLQGFSDHFPISVVLEEKI